MRLVRAVIAYDLEGWVLHGIALQWARRLAIMGWHVELVSCTCAAARWIAIVRDRDIVFFLSPWDFARLRSITPGFSAVAVHHLTTLGRATWLRALAKADAVVASNEGIETEVQSFLASCGASVPVIRSSYGLDPDEFLQTEFPPPFCTAGVVRVAFAGKASSNDEDRKGIDRLWCVLRRWIELYPGRVLRLSLLGPSGVSGWSYQNVPEDLRTMVVLPGLLRRKEVLGELGAVDAYLCLSRVEGGPYPVIESMALGRVVISTPVGMVPKAIRDRENGFLVDGDDSGGIVRLLDELAADPDRARQIGHSALQTARTTMMWPCVFAREQGDAQLVAAFYAKRYRWRFLRLLRCKFIYIAYILRNGFAWIYRHKANPNSVGGHRK